MSERLFAVTWMIIGIAFYSYAIGNMTTLIENLDKDRETVNN